MQQPPAPTKPRHSAFYWTLFVLFFPVTIPYVALKWSILSIRDAPPREPRVRPPKTPKAHTAHKRKPSLATRINRVSRGLGRINRTVNAVKRADKRNRRGLGTRKY